VIGLIWAQADGGVIGANGTMPWHLPEDLAHFKAVTMGNAVVMGRATWESIPARFRPLPGRRNIVLTRDNTWSDDGALTVHSLTEAVTAADGDELWVIGGGQVYAAAVDIADVAVITRIDRGVAGDTTAPVLGADWEPVTSEPAVGWHSSSTGLRYRFERWQRH